MGLARWVRMRMPTRRREPRMRVTRSPLSAHPLRNVLREVLDDGLA